jgi:hypothetical protein
MRFFTRQGRALLLAAVMAVGAVCILGCNNPVDNSTHTHTWGAWKSNATQHWKECGCGEEYGRANHTGIPNCSVCNYPTGGSGLFAAPTGLTVTVTSNTILANWNAVSGAAGYILYVSVSSNFESDLSASEQMTGTSYTENFTADEIPPGTTLYFRVSAINSYGEGAKSSVVSKTIPGTPTYSLDGVWHDGDFVITISGNTAVITQLEKTGTGYWQDAINKGYIKVGDQHFRNLTKTGDLTWTSQELTVQYSAPNVATGKTGWTNCTITMNANGQTFSSSNGNTFTRKPI